MTAFIDINDVAYSRTSPEANVVLTAAGRLDGRLQPPLVGIPPRLAGSLAAWLQDVGDAMSDDHAEEREHPEHIPAARWKVHATFGQDGNEEWTHGLAVARALLDRPDPNAA